MGIMYNWIPPQSSCRDLSFTRDVKHFQYIVGFKPGIFDMTGGRFSRVVVAEQLGM